MIRLKNESQGHNAGGCRVVRKFENHQSETDGKNEGGIKKPPCGGLASCSPVAARWSDCLSHGGGGLEGVRQRGGFQDVFFSLFGIPIFKHRRTDFALHPAFSKAIANPACSGMKRIGERFSLGLGFFRFDEGECLISESLCGGISATAADLTRASDDGSSVRVSGDLEDQRPGAYFKEGDRHCIRFHVSCLFV